MAKGFALVSNIKGKIGNNIFYSLKNSNNKVTQGIRVYQPNVSNPQTTAQVVQRLKMTAVNNFYRQMKAVINRGFEGVEYGDASRRKYLKLALGTAFQGPYLEKGSRFGAPTINVPLTEGSLPAVTCTFEGVNKGIVTSLAISGEDAPTTVADLATRLIESNSYLQAGDQVSFILGGFTTGVGFIYDVISVYLNAEDDATLASQGITMGAPVGGKLVVASFTASEHINAAAVAISRDGEGSHLRSTSSMIVDGDVRQEWYDLSAEDMAYIISTYQKQAGATSTDWPVEPTRGSGNASAQVVYLNNGSTVNVVRLEQRNGVLAAITDTGVAYYLWQQNVQAVNYHYIVTSKTTQTSGPQATPPDGVTAANSLSWRFGDIEDLPAANGLALYNLGLKASIAAGMGE